MSAWLSRLFHGPAAREDQFARLVRPHIHSLFRMAFRWTGDASESEDLVQDVLARLVPRLDEVQSVDRLGPWLVKVLYHRYVDLYRKDRRSPIDTSLEWDEQLYCIEHDHDVMEGSSGQMELRHALERALLQLDDRWRDAVLLHDVEGYTVLEVAEILDINVGTVKSRLHRARKQLKKVLEAGTVSESRAC